MARELVTLFDSNYLVKAVAMHASLRAVAGDDVTLTCCCFDARAKRILDALALPGLRAIALEDLEASDPELAAVKPTRTPTEYCWTSTPALIRHVLDTRPDVDEVTYIDADLLFFSSPEALFAEMGDASICIVPHRYATAYKAQEVNGIYCVQWNTFRRDERGLAALDWWRERCLEWCFYRLEDGKLGDQKYLDDWPERFAGVHVLEHKGGGLAPWNVPSYDIRAGGPAGVLVDDDPLVFFHYHRVRLREGGEHDWRPPGYAIDDETFALVYAPYLRACDEALALIRTVEPGFDAGLDPAPTLRERAQAVRADTGSRLAARWPWLLRVRYPKLRRPRSSTS
jgi:hypothetical protein